MEYEDLNLDLSLSSYAPSEEKQKVTKQVVCLSMSTNLLPKEEAIDLDWKAENQYPVKRSSSTDHHHCNHDHIENNKGCRKKLRLTKEQSALLEDSLKLHSTPSTIQKQSLAQKLNLRPRQVEVWFQNRRARTKSKQTEMDCKFLKKWCEELSDENQKLKKELQELRAIKVGASSLCSQLLKANTLTLCSSCEKPRIS